jgi:hypothetical protein
MESLDWVACERCGATFEDVEPSAIECWNARAAISAQPQPDAVEAVAWLCVDKVERRQHTTTSAEDAADRRSRPGVWTVTPLYTAPPLAPDERLRRAIASCEGEQKKFEEWATAARYDMHEHPLHYLFLDAKTNAARMGWKAALRYVETLLPAGADEGKESEGAIAGPLNLCPEMLRRDALLDRPSDPTPPDPKPWPNGCRNPNSCSIHRDCMYLQCKHYERDISGEVDDALQRGGA